MGGVPVLLMIATLGWGITYGWQPDESGSGVEYLIQIPPGELEQLQRIGEISSSIDPAVRGRVSRIVIRVGNATLPRTTPANWDATGNIAADDRPLAIPEIASTNTRATTMKPDPQGGGFSLPASLTDAANAVRSNIDQAGREIAAAANDPFRGTLGGSTASNNPADPRSAALVAPPGTRAGGTNQNATGLNGSSGFAPPAFTSSGASGQASGWGNGPSTDPSGRDNSWLGTAGQGSAAGGNAGPSTDPTDPSYFGAASRASASLANPANPASLNANGLRPSDTFGQTPTGITSPRGFPADQRTNSLGQTAQGALGRQAPALSQYEQMLIDRQNRGQTTSGLNSSNSAQQARAPQSPSQQTTSQQTLAQQNLAQQKLWAEQQSRINQNQGNPGPNSASNGGSALDPSNEPLGYRKASTTEPDSRLTNAQLAANAWSVDALERVYDVYGQLMPNEVLRWNNTQTAMGATNSSNPNYSTNQSQYPRNDVDPRLATASTYPTDPRYGQTAVNNDSRYPAGTTQGLQTPRFDTTFYPSQNSQASESVDPRWTNSGYPAGTGQTGNSAQGYPAPAGNYVSNQAAIDRFERESLIAAREEARLASANSSRDSTVNAQRDPPSLSDRGTNSLGLDNGRSDSIPQVAAQPLFNGLLLISFVANVYLVFWLKNLRLQFRDMVAAKRVTSANSVVS